MKEQKVLFTLFGASGDLAARKIFPSLYFLYMNGFLVKNFAVLGIGRHDWDDKYFRIVVLNSLSNMPGPNSDKVKFIEHFYYSSKNVTESQDYVDLKETMADLDQKYDIGGNQIFYLAMAPRFFGTIAINLKENGLLTKNGYNRIMVEKPFGTDLKTATELNEVLTKAFVEEDIYRVDHYLGKQMVQGLIPLRFNNSLVTNIWNDNFIDNIQITLSETVGVEARAGYYDQSGAMRDMVQNHILQILSFTAMEQPKTLSENDILQNKISFFENLKIYNMQEASENFVRGQYTETEIAGKTFPSYNKEDNVAPDSQTETFVAGKIQLTNGSLKNTPIYVRTGKHLAVKKSVIDIIFKNNDIGKEVSNIFTVIIEPDLGYKFKFNGKDILNEGEIEALNLDYDYPSADLSKSFSSYDLLILDVLLGKRLNFAHFDELKYAWEFTDVILDAWRQNLSPLNKYLVGSMGPLASEELLLKDGRQWNFSPSIDLDYYKKA